MSAPEKQPKKPVAENADAAPVGSFTSLTRTLEDLEARLGRLSVAKGDGDPATPADDETGGEQPSTTARLRAVIEQRLAGSSRLALDAAGGPEEAEGGARRKRASAALDRRFGTIAGEVEALRMQGATLQLVSSVADELQALKAEISGNIAARNDSGFDQIKNSFEELRGAIEARDEDGTVSGQIVAILERLSQMQASGVDRGSLDLLRNDLDAVSQLVSGMAREETMTSVGRRWDAFEARLEAHIELDGAAKSDLRAELERLRETVRSLATEEQIRAVEGRWDEFEAHYFDKLRTESEDHLGRFMRGELEALGARIDALALAGSSSDLGARLERIETGQSTAQIEETLKRLSARFGDLEEALVAIPDLLGVDRLEQRLQELTDSVALIAEQQADPDLEQFIVLEERLDEISQAIVASALREDAPFDMAPIERIEARVAGLAARLERLASEGDPERLSDRIAQLSSRIEELAARPQAADLDERMQSFAARIEAALVQIERPQAETVFFEERLSALAVRLEGAASARVDEDVVRSLETQITRLAAQLAQGPAVALGDADPDMQRRLSAIEQRLDDNRAEVMSAARIAADEAVRLMLQEGARREGEHVRDLSDDLRSLEALCRESDDRSIQVFEAVHATLVKIADRLMTIEGEVRQSDAASRSQEAARPSAVPMFAMPELDAIVAQQTVQPATDPSAVSPEASLAEAPAPRGLRAAIARHLGGRAAAKGDRSASQALADAVATNTTEPGSLSGDDDHTPRRADLTDAPSLDAADSIVSREVNRPLEPGSGAPDIASLLERVRMQQRGETDAAEPIAKADFIAAARKAALAAAAEADSLRQETIDEESDPTMPAKGRFGRHRKPILMAVGAVLLAMMAMPLGRAYLERDGGGIVEIAEAPAAIETTAEPTQEIAAIPEAAADIDAEATASVEAASVETPAVADVEMTATEPSRVAAAMPAAPIAAETAAAPIVAEAPVADETVAEMAVADEIIAIPVIARSEESVAALAASRATIGHTDSEFQTASLVSQAAMTASVPERPAPLVPDAELAAPLVAEFPMTPEEEASPILARAVSKLPESATIALPRPPAAIGPTPLVAAADGGDAKAIFEIGLRLMEGRVGEPQPTEALAWFAHSARLGYAPAQYSLGTLFEKGNGIERDTGAARDWYLLAADDGNVRAMHNLAVLYATGIEGKSEPETAARWFTQAAEHGMRDSQYNLGILHARGAGVDQDLAQSYKWFSIVGATGDRDAVTKRDEVAKTLGEDEIATLDAEVAAWKAKPRNEAANSVDIPPTWSEEPEQTASVDMKRAVRNVQAILIKLGFDPGTPDGVVGTRTTEAVRAFQEQNGLASTGSIDEQLIRELLKQNV